MYDTYSATALSEKPSEVKYSEPGVVQLAHFRQLDWVGGSGYEVCNSLYDRDCRSSTVVLKLLIGDKSPAGE
jgi:hypothetical protein